jgi:hypothetical protein
MPAQDIYDPKRWRSRAKEMRVLAEGMYNTKTRRIVTRLADRWDKMADRAERRGRKLAASPIAARPRTESEKVNNGRY